MNRLNNSLLKSVSALIALILLVSCNVWPQKTKTIRVVPDDYEVLPGNQTDRESITFILGEDKDTKNPYYTEAYKYYQHNKSAQTTYIDTKCRSLLEVKNYLTINSPCNKQPWGVVNLVSHGDEWLGLSVKVKPDSKRSTLERLKDFNHSATNSPLPDSIVDAQTQIIIHACGVGNNQELIASLELFFKSKNFIPGIRAPKLFEFYATEINPQGKTVQLQYVTQAWMIAYKNAKKPGDIIIGNLLHEKYPNSTIDWIDALKREHPRSGGDTYHYTFDIPIMMSVKISGEDSAQDLNSDEKKLKWITRQPEIAQALLNVKLSANNFSWNLKHGYTTDKSGKKSPAIVIKGFCTMLCVLKPMLKEAFSADATPQPLVPAIHDQNFYYEIKGRYCLNK